MSSQVMATDEAIKELRTYIEGLTVGAYGVVSVTSERGEDHAGDEAVFFTVLLDDPEGDTWPIDDILEFRDRINRQAVELGVPISWYVSTQSVTPDEFDPEDVAPDSTY